MQELRKSQLFMPILDQHGTGGLQPSKTANPLTLSHTSLGTLQLETADLSDGGVFLKTAAEQCPAIGDEVTLQVVGSLGGEAPHWYRPASCA
jgi:hypothetical protein